MVTEQFLLCCVFFILLKIKSLFFRSCILWCKHFSNSGRSKQGIFKLFATCLLNNNSKMCHYYGIGFLGKDYFKTVYSDLCSPFPQTVEHHVNTFLIIFACDWIREITICMHFSPICSFFLKESSVVQNKVESGKIAGKDFRVYGYKLQTAYVMFG